MAEKPAVRPNTAVGDSLRAVARDVLAEARAALGNRDKPDAVAVHDYRKAMKRWRALLRLLEPMLGEDCKRLRAEAREFARSLGGARDAQAAIEALEDLVDAEAALSPRSVATIRGRLDAIRQAAEATTLNDNKRAELMAALDAAEATVDAWPVDKITFSDLSRELAATYRRARDAVPDDWAAAEPERLHELRRRVIAHRYQMELVEPLWPRLGRVWVAEAQRLRDRLGEYQDLSVLLGFTLPHQPLAPWRSRLTPAIAERRADHALAASRIAKRLLAEKPKAFRRRLEALWKSSD